MTIQTTVGSTAWPPPLMMNNSPIQLALRGAFSVGSGFATLLSAPKTGNISGVEFWCGSVTGPFNPYTVSIQSVDSTGATPTGAILSGGNGSATFVPATNTWITTTFTSSVSVTRGDLIAVVWTAPSANAGTYQMNFVQATSLGHPNDLYWTGSAWTAPGTNGNNCFALRYSDGSYGYNPYVNAITNVTTYSMTNATNPAQAGLKFSLPFPVSVNGAYCTIESPNTAGAFELVLYDATGNYSSVLTKTAVGTYESKGYFANFFFPNTVVLTPNVPYRLVMRPTSTTALKLTKYNTNSTALTAACKGAPNVYWTQCSISNPIDNSTWTDITTACPISMGLYLNGFSDGASGSSVGVSIPIITYLG